jgi:hypothetical protein
MEELEETEGMDNVTGKAVKGLVDGRQSDVPIALIYRRQADNKETNILNYPACSAIFSTDKTKYVQSEI